MDVVGKIIAALPPKSGTSQSTGKPWQVNTYVLQTNEQTPKNIAFDVFGAERVEQLRALKMATLPIMTNRRTQKNKSKVCAKMPEAAALVFISLCRAS